MARSISGLSGVAFVAGVLLGGGEAHADAKQECTAAYERTQLLRDAGKLVEAREQARVCGAATCAAFVVKDCVQWLSEIEASLPTVVFAAEDASGADTTSVRVSIDGKAAAETLDGKAIVLNPGRHTLRFEIAGADPIEQEIIARQGDKLRRVAVSFRKEAAPAVAPSSPALQPAPVPAPQAASPGPWIVGGIGVAALIAGAATGGVVLHNKSVANANCTDGPPPTCRNQTGLDAASAVRTLGPVTTVALTVGAAAVVTGAIWLSVRRSNGSSVGVGVAPAYGGAIGKLQGSWR